MILIKNVKIIDGTGKPAYPGDVLLVGDKISAIGNFPHRQADQVIEGLGSYLTPGFIDGGANIDHDLSLFTNPGQYNYLARGVTTTIGGRCGASLAPLLYGSLESIRKWGDTDRINVDWSTVEDFFQSLKRLKLGVNFGTLIGHSTIRRSLLGEEQRELTEKEVKIFQTIIRESLEDGALGFSTGLEFSHTRQTPYRELKILTSILSKYKGIHAVHLRHQKENIFSAVNEIIKLYRETGVKTLVSHFYPLKKLGKEFDATFNLINKTSGLMDFHFNVALTEENIVPIYLLLPEWAREGSLENMLEKINDVKIAKKIAKEIKFEKGGLRIAEAIGCSFLDNKEIYNAKELLEIMKITRLRALVGWKNIDYDRLKKIVFYDNAFIAGTAQSFANFLDISKENKDYSIEKAIEKITGKVSNKFNIKNRGVIKEGNFADLTVLLNNRPHYVIVNGQIVVYKGAFKQEVSAGQVINR